MYTARAFAHVPPQNIVYPALPLPQKTLFSTAVLPVNGFCAHVSKISPWPSVLVATAIVSPEVIPGAATLWLRLTVVPETDVVRVRVGMAVVGIPLLSTATIGQPAPPQFETAVTWIELPRRYNCWMRV